MNFMGYAVLVASALVLMLVPHGEPDIKAGRRSVFYWWTLASLGWGGALQAIRLMTPVGFTLTASVVITYTPMIAIGAYAMLMMRTKELSKISAASLLLGAFFIYSFGFVILRDADYMPLLSLAVMLPAIFTRAAPVMADIRCGLLASSRVIGLTLLGLAVLYSDTLLGPCRLDKCSLFSTQLGSLGMANAFGLTLTIVGVLAAFCLSAKWKVLLYLFAAALLTDLSVSRSALLPLAIGSAAVIVQRFIVAPKMRRFLSVCLVAGTVYGVLWTAFGSWSPTAFTGRAALWIYARSIINAEWVFGYGSSYWVRLPAASGVFANYATHNVLLELLVLSGVVGLLLVGISLISVWRKRTPASSSLLYVAFVTWIASGVTEVVSLPGRVYLLAGVFPLLYLIGRSMQPSDQQPDTPAGQATKTSANNAAGVGGGDTS